MRRAIYFFPHNPYPPHSGAHKRCLELLAGLAASGYETLFASSTFSSETAWNEEGRTRLLTEGASAVAVHEPSRLDRILSRMARKYYRRTRQPVPFGSNLTTPPGMRWWFRRICRSFKPDLIILSYSFWDRLLNEELRRSARCAVDIIDLSSVNGEMRKKIQQQLPRRRQLQSGRLSPSDVPDSMLVEEFFRNLNVSAATAEYRIFDQYDYAIGISPQETDLVTANTSHARVLYIPMSHDVVQLANNYSGSALFTTGPNPMNTQAYFYFVKKVLPKLQLELPEFVLEVTGSVCERVTPQQGIRLSGFVPDLDAIYAAARFLVCPIIGNTGQLVKIVEAMAHGLPVVALEAAAAGSPIQHGTNGLIARDATEFAEYCERLWRDAEMCRRMGAAARSTIATDFSRSKILNLLSGLN